MGAARGIAGSRRPEVEGIFVCRGEEEAGFFLQINNTVGRLISGPWTALMRGCSSTTATDSSTCPAAYQPRESDSCDQTFPCSLVFDFARRYGWGQAHAGFWLRARRRCDPQRRWAKVVSAWRLQVSRRRVPICRRRAANPRRSSRSAEVEVDRCSLDGWAMTRGSRRRRLLLADNPSTWGFVVLSPLPLDLTARLEEAPCVPALLRRQQAMP